MAPQVEINAGEEGSSESVWAAVALFVVVCLLLLLVLCAWRPGAALRLRSCFRIAAKDIKKNKLVA